MKNKKLFAILTLVCFMFTLMPVAAFAAAPAVGVLEDGKLDQSITVTEGDVVDLFVDAAKCDDYLFAIVKDGVLYATTTGAYEFEKEGTYTVYAVCEADVASFVNDAAMTKAAKWTLIQEKDSFVDDVLTVKVKAAKNADYEIVLSGDVTGAEGEYKMNINANNGWTDGDGEAVATLLKNGEEVKGAELTFSTAGYVDLTFEDGKTTNRGGEVEFKATSERTGEYKVVVKYGTKAKATLTVTVQAESVANVAAENVPTAPVDVDQAVEDANIEFKFTDASGNAYDVDVDDVNVVKLTVAAKPANSDVEADDFTLIDDKDKEKGVYRVAGAFDEEGEYTFKVTLKNGKSATATVKALEMGDVVGIKYDVYNTPVTVAYGDITQVKAVLAYDANGVTADVSNEAVFSATGKAIASFDSDVALLTVKDNDELIGEKITVMAVYGDFVATTTLTVVDKAATINYGEMNAEVGVNAKFVGSVVDGEGQNSSIKGQVVGTPKAIVLDKPENAVVAVSGEMDDKGRVVMNFLASEVGEYKVQTIVNYGVNNSYVTSIDTVTVGAGVGTYDDIVVMSIGANKIVVNSEVVTIDAAPIVENGRTFVPFRALAEAFGAEVAFDEATQAVTATLGDVTVVMTIGSAEYTVNGEVKTADVAPFINGSRTMVPVRFVAEAFGINVTPVYGDNGATVDVLFAK